MCALARRFACATLAVLAFVTYASGAMALSVSPSGSVSGTSPVLNIRLTSTNEFITCASSSFTAILNTNGSGSVAAGSMGFGGCASPQLGTFTITQTSAISINTVLLPSPAGVLVQFTIPSRGIVFADVPLGCSFTLSGTFGILVPGPLPITSSTFALTLSSLRVDSTGGLCMVPAPVGLPAVFSATYNSNHSIRFSG